MNLERKHPPPQKETRWFGPKAILTLTKQL